MDQLRTCHRCHRMFPVLSDLFNHTCDDEKDLLSSNLTNDKTSLFNKISSTSPESFNLNHHSSTSSLHTNKLTSPLSPSSSPTKDLNHTETEHIPLFKRPLFQPNDKKQYSSNNYFSLRYPPSPIRVNS